MKKLKEKTITGLSWGFLIQSFTQIISVITWIILARVLAPGEFGLLAMVIVLMKFMQILRNLGISEAIVQTKSIDKKKLSSAFYFHVLFSIFLGLILWLTHPIIASFYSESREINVVLGLLTLDFIVGSIVLVPNAIMLRRLMFKEVFIIDLIAVFISASVSILLAFNGYGYLSLVLKIMCYTLIHSILVLIISRWNPGKFGFTFDNMNLFRFGLPLVGTQMINYFSRNIDDILIGREFGKHSLGIYNRSYAIMLIPLSTLTAAASKVLFPVFSIMQDEQSRVGSNYLRATRIIAFVSFPTMLILCLLSKDIIFEVLGNKWSAMVPIVRILSLLGMIQSICSINGSIFQALDKTILLLKMNVVSASIVVVSILLGVYTIGTIEGVSCCYGIASILIALPIWHILGKLISLSLLDILGNFVSILLCSLAMGIFVLLLNHVEFTMSSFLLLTIKVTLALVFYFFIAHFFKVKALIEIKALIRSKMLVQ